MGGYGKQTIALQKLREQGEGGKEWAGQRTCIHPHCMSPSVFFYFCCWKKKWHRTSHFSSPLSCHIRAVQQLYTTNFYLSLFTGQEEGSGVNSSACHVGLTVWMFHVPQWFNTRNKSNMFFVLLSNFFKFKDMGWIKSTQIISLTLVEFI